MRAVPVRSSARDGSEWLTPSGKIPMAAPSASSLMTASKTSRFWTHRGGIVLFSVDGNGAGRLHHPAHVRIREEGCLGQESDPPTRHPGHDDGIHQGVGMVGHKQDRATG